MLLHESYEGEFTAFTEGLSISSPPARHGRLSTCSAVTVDDLMSQLSEPLIFPLEVPHLDQEGVCDPSAARSMFSCSPPDLPLTGTYQPGQIQTAHLASEAVTSQQKLITRREKDRQGNGI